RTVCPTSPTLTPAAVTTPAAAPCATERDMTRIMSWPGVAMSTSEAAMNRSQDASAIDKISLHGEGLRPDERSTAPADHLKDAAASSTRMNLTRDDLDEH